MKWLDVSEIVAGLAMAGRINPEFIRTPTLAPPYDEIVSHLANGLNMTDLIDRIGLQPITTAKDAAGSVGDDNDISWIGVLEKTYHREEQSRVLERNLKHLRGGEDLDTNELLGLVDESWEKANYVTGDTLTGKEVIWRPTHYPPIDYHIGNPQDNTQSGTPEAGLTIIAGPPGCLAGNTDVIINRAGKSFHISMEELELRFNHKVKRGGKEWDYSIDTYTQSRYEDGTIRLNKIETVTWSGVKPCYTLITEYGTVTGTIDHPILTPTGWVELGKLQPGNVVYVNGGQKKKGKANRKHYSAIEGLKYHPYAGRTAKGRFSVPYHRLILEAHLSNFSLLSFIAKCRTGNFSEWEMKFVNPEEYAVHHIDGDITNNTIENLVMMTHKDHWKLHSERDQRNVQYISKESVVIGVEIAEVQPTYDIEMENDPHNFLANGFVVHNTGKTTLLAKMMNSRIWAGKKCLMYTLEMTAEQYLARVKNCGDLTQGQLSNLILCERVMTADEIYTEAVRVASLEGVDCIGVDFADLIVSGKEDEPAVADAYKKMANLAKRTRVPVFLLAQLSRKYESGMPRVNNIRWSGLAEALASLILLIYNPNTIYANMGSSNDLPMAPGRAYIIVGKSRFGYREGGPGAIQVDFEGKTGWGNESKGWFSLKSV